MSKSKGRPIPHRRPKLSRRLDESQARDRRGKVHARPRAFIAATFGRIPPLRDVEISTAFTWAS